MYDEVVFLRNCLTLYLAMSQNRLTHFKNLAAFAAGFLKSVGPFHDIAK